MSKELIDQSSLPTPPPSTFIPLPNNLEPLNQFEQLTLPPPLSSTNNNYIPSRANYYHSSIPSSKSSNYDSRVVVVVGGGSSNMNNLLNPMPTTESYQTETNSSSSNTRLSRATPTTLTSGNNNDSNEESWPSRGYFSDKDPLFNHPGTLPSPNSQSSSLPPLPSPLPIPLMPNSSSNFIPLVIPGKRARRSVNSKPPIPRQLSPFELSPTSQSIIETEASSSTTTTTTTSSMLNNTTNRKVSHSLIERRRREKINDCLASLRQMVPQCRVEARAKEVRAKERTRKRGRGNKDDDAEDGEGEGPRGGLHKLQILVGTISYIQELESRLAAYEEIEGIPKISEPTTTTYSSSSDDVVISPPKSRGPPTFRGFEQPLAVPNGSINSKISNTNSNSISDIVELDDRAAGLLLLKFSTSPELRPVFFSD